MIVVHAHARMHGEVRPRCCNALPETHLVQAASSTGHAGRICFVTREESWVLVGVITVEAAA